MLKSKREEVLDTTFHIYEVDNKCNRIESGISQDFMLSDILLILASHHLVTRSKDWLQSTEYWQVASGLEDCLDREDLEGMRFNIRPVLYVFRPTGADWVIFFTKDQPGTPFVFGFSGVGITKLSETQEKGLMQLWQNPLGGQTIAPEIIAYLNSCDPHVMPLAS